MHEAIINLHIFPQKCTLKWLHLDVLSKNTCVSQIPQSDFRVWCLDDLGAQSNHFPRSDRVLRQESEPRLALPQGLWAHQAGPSCRLDNKVQRPARQTSCWSGQKHRVTRQILQQCRSHRARQDQETRTRGSSRKARPGNTSH